MEKALREIAKELKLIRIELQREGDFLYGNEQADRDVNVKVDGRKVGNIADQLNDMFKR